MKKLCAALACIAIIGFVTPSFSQNAKPATLHIVDLINSGQITKISVKYPLPSLVNFISSEQFKVLPNNILHVKGGNDYYLLLDRYRVYSVDGKKLIIYPE
jgi:hypothetical protein